MKILCVSDLHGNKKAMKKIEEVASNEKIDVLINAGDFADRKEAKQFFDGLKVRTFFVHGNWDNDLRTDNDLVTIMKNDVVKYDGYYFMGLDSRSLLIENLFSLTKNIPADKMVLITHEPPFGILDLTWIGNNAGFLEFRELVETKKPILHVFGHIHESGGHIDYEGTLFLNAAFQENKKIYIVNLPSKRIREIKV